MELPFHVINDLTQLKKGDKYHKILIEGACGPVTIW
jgi:hypothetical protein